MIHRTLTDDLGNHYKVVASWWLKLLTVVSIIEFVGLVLIIAVLLDNSRAVEKAMTYSDVTQQRYAALAEIAGERARGGKWAFEQTCKMVKEHGGQCIDEPNWYADPDKYPLLVNDPAGVGIFPPTPTPTQLQEK